MMKEYGDFWDKQRLIDACLELCKDDWCSVRLPKIGKDMSKIDEIQAKRIQAVLKTHNIDYEFLTDDFDSSNLTIELSEEEQDKICGFDDMISGIVHIVSNIISSEAVSELNILLKSCSGLNDEFDLGSYSTRCAIFNSLFFYRKKIENLKDCFNGVLECPVEEWYAIKVTDGIFEKDFKSGIEKLDRALALLMGDNFKNPIPVSELKAKYGYPPMSDSELQDLIYDSW